MTLINTQASNPHDLDELAFRYVANEMSLDERTTFESRLETDLAACEAVAAAVELTQAIAMSAGSLCSAGARSVELPSSPVTWFAASLRPLAWMSVGAAACFALVTLSSIWSSNGNRIGSVASNSTVAAAGRVEKLAEVWSQIRRSDVGESVAMDNDSAFSDSVDPLTDDSLDVSPPPAPSWLTAAVSGLAEKKTTADPAGDDVEEL